MCQKTRCATALQTEFRQAMQRLRRESEEHIMSLNPASFFFYFTKKSKKQWRSDSPLHSLIDGRNIHPSFSFFGLTIQAFIRPIWLFLFMICCIVVWFLPYTHYLIIDTTRGVNKRLKVFTVHEHDRQMLDSRRFVLFCVSQWLHKHTEGIDWPSQ